MHVVVSQAEVAKRAGVTPMAVSKAVKDGRLDRLPNGIDLKARKTVDYISTAKHQRRNGERQKGGDPGEKRAQQGAAVPRKRGPRGKKRAEVPAGGGPLELNGETYNMAELRKKVADADKVEQDLAIRRGELLERSDVKKVFSSVYQIIGSQVKTLAEKLGPDITAALGLTEDQVPRVQELMSVDILRALAGIKREFNVYLDKIEEEQIKDQ